MEGGGAWPGNTQHQGTAGVKGAGGSGGPGCGAGGRWRGLAGLRADAPSEARGADGSRAGRRPRAHRAARPAHPTAPETPAAPQQATSNKQQATSNAYKIPTRNRVGISEPPVGIEPTTYSVNAIVSISRSIMPIFSRDTNGKCLHQLPGVTRSTTPVSPNNWPLFWPPLIARVPERASKCRARRYRRVR